jgi:hypothetical protein
VYLLCAQQQFWGSNLDGVVAAPIDFGSAAMNDLIVYSTHLYGECGFHYMCLIYLLLVLYTWRNFWLLHCTALWLVQYMHAVVIVIDDSEQHTVDVMCVNSEH